MKKRKPWGLIIVDESRKKYAFTGVIVDDSPWNARVMEERKKGRSIRCFSHEASNDDKLREWELQEGVMRTSIEDILSLPEDTTTLYKGVLPQYAAHANRRRVVKILCRGRCGTNRWAELDRDYPGEDTLRNAGLGDLHATCLVCGYRAIDNYNWMRD